jgi:hypothetical protein
MHRRELAFLFHRFLKIPRIASVLPGEYTSNTSSSDGLATMKQPITIRLDPDLLATARIRAKEENRTLTNFLETALKERFGAAGISRPSSQSADGRTSGRQRNFKRSFNAKS